MGFDSDLVRFMAHSTQYLLGHLATDAAHEPKGETAMPPSLAARASGFELPRGFAGIEAEPLPA